VPDVIVWPVLDAMLECLITTFEAEEKPPGVIRHHFGSGTAVPQISPDGNDNECCDGLVWVRVAEFYNSGNDQLTPYASASSCFENMAVPIEIGAVRCWPAAGGFATPEDWAATTYDCAQDAAALRRAVTCCFLPGNESRWQVVVGRWRPVGVSGQCVGGILPLTVAPNAVECCPTGETSP
jgi:hypothetical protein